METLVAGHARKARESGAVRETDKNGLPLVVGMVRGGDGVGANSARVLEKQSVARVARALLNAAQWFFAAPDQDLVGKAERARPAADLFGFGSGIGAQAMVHSRHMKGNGNAEVAPMRGKTHQRQGIWAAGHGEHQAGERLETGEQNAWVKFVKNPRVRFAQQEAFFASRSAASFWAGGAFGYWRGIAEKKAQACSLPPRALSETPSFNMASGATGLLA